MHRIKYTKGDNIYYDNQALPREGKESTSTTSGSAGGTKSTESGIVCYTSKTLVARHPKEKEHSSLRHSPSIAPDVENHIDHPQDKCPDKEAMCHHP